MTEGLALLPFSEIETASLALCESVIERGLKTFIEVGEALARIRQYRLYRLTHGTFEEYCSERWGMTRRYANILIEASETVAVMGTIVPILPATGSQVRPLTPLKDEPALVVAAWEDAQEIAQQEGLASPVARHVEEAAAPYREALKRNEQAEKEAAAPLSIFDGAGKSRHFDYKQPEQIIEDVRAQKAVHVSHNSGENEWYTPSEYIEAARATMGSIALDPASNPLANETVQAFRYFTAEDNGLAQEWRAETLWMNPPYSSDLVKQFAAKFAAHVKAGDIGAGIVLVNNATETRWFAEIASVCTAVVFPTGRIRFMDKTGAPCGAPLQGQAILYAGNDAGRFLQHFGGFGWAALIPNQKEVTE